jgi:hypothetical protein
MSFSNTLLRIPQKFNSQEPYTTEGSEELYSPVIHFIDEEIEVQDRRTVQPKDSTLTPAKERMPCEGRGP